MHRIDSEGHENNLFVDEDANQAIEGTKMAADWLNAIQEELINILVAAEIDPNKASNDQLALAFQLLGGSKDWADIENKPLGLSPTGLVIITAGSVAPLGYLECNGAELSRTVYSDLFSVCGTIHGAGDGSTTFKIPELRGEFIRGWDNGKGTDGDRVLGELQNDALQDHRHYAGLNQLYDTVTDNSDTAEVINAPNAGIDFDTLGVSYQHGYVGTGRISTETRSRNIALMHCIKY